MCVQGCIQDYIQPPPPLPDKHNPLPLIQVVPLYSFMQNLLYVNEVHCLLRTWSSRIKHRVAWERVTNVLNKHTVCNVSVQVVICTLQLKAVCSFSTLIPIYHTPRRRIKKNLTYSDLFTIS